MLLHRGWIQTKLFSQMLPWNKSISDAVLWQIYFSTRNYYSLTFTTECCHLLPWGFFDVDGWIFLLGHYAMHIPRGQIFCGQVCQWWPCPLRKWLQELLDRFALPPDLGTRWLLAGGVQRWIELACSYTICFDCLLVRFIFSLFCPCLQYERIWREGCVSCIK